MVSGRKHTGRQGVNISFSKDHCVDREVKTRDVIAK